MTDERFIATTRPAEKFRTLEQKPCLEIVNVPLTAISEKNFQDQEIENIAGFDPEVVVFTSQRGVDVYFSDIDPYLKRRQRRYYGVGQSTCRTVQENGYLCIMPERRDSQGLGETVIRREKGSRVLLFRSDQANRILDDILSASEMAFLNVTAYNVIRIRRADISPFLDENCAGIVFTSSMEVEAFVSLTGDKLHNIVRSGTRFFSIGTFTTRTMEKHSIPVSEPVGNSDFEQLIQDICTRYFRN